MIGNSAMGKLFLRTFTFALAVVSASSGSAFAGGDDVAAVLPFSKKFRGVTFGAGDSDRIGFDDIALSKITATVERDGPGSHTFTLELLDSADGLLATGTSNASGSKVTLTDFPLPGNGRYYLRVAGSGAATYELSLKGKPPKKPAIPDGTIAAPAEIDALVFSARAGSVLNGSIVRTSGPLTPRVVELVAPSGALLVVTGSKQIKSDKKSVTFSEFDLPEYGEYRIRITGNAGTTGGYSAALKVEPPKPEKGVVYEAGHPFLEDADDFTLIEVFVARGVKYVTDAPIQLESPYTYAETDPLTGLTDDGSIEPLYAGAPQGAAGFIPFNLDDLLSPPVVPRDGVFVMRFNQNVDPNTLSLDAKGRLTGASPIRVMVLGNPAPIEVSVVGKEIILDPVVDDSPGFAASPLLLDSNGVAVAAAAGVGGIEIVSAGIRATNGAPYEPRPDLLGSVDAGGLPIPFNPGNAKLDTFAGIGVGGGSVTFGGFLPSKRSPRIVREIAIEGVFAPDLLSPALGDLQGPNSLAIVLDAPLDVSENGGKGEYAGGVVRLRPGEDDEEVRRIKKHTVVALSTGKFRNEFFLDAKIAQPLAAPTSKSAADSYAVVRLEYFEPDPSNPIDPSTFDPLDPDLGENQQFANFIEVEDRNGVKHPLGEGSELLDPLSKYTVRFDRSMDIDSFRPYESFRIDQDPISSNPGLVVLGRVVASDSARAMTFEPGREIQFGVNAGTFEPLAVTPTPGAFRFTLNCVPKSAVLDALLGSAGATQFLALGQRGVTDVTGRPLALPPTLLTPSKPFWSFSESLLLGPDPAAVTHGAVVHRFMGQPLTGQAGNGNAGVRFHDMPTSICGIDGNLYGPRIADVNLFSNGFLSGAPVAFFQKIHDDFNPPPATQLSAFPFGASTPFGGFAVLGGTRMQHVYRAVDASPDFESLKGTLLDLQGIAFAPLGGVVTNSILPDVSIHAGHTSVVPDTAQSVGIPTFPTSGLTSPSSSFKMGGHQEVLGDLQSAKVPGAYNAVKLATNAPMHRQLVHGVEKPGTTTDFYDGRSITLDAKNQFSPVASPSRAYLRIPTAGFDRPFPYDNGDFDVALYPSGASFGTPFQPRNHSLVLEYRVRVVDASSPPATANAFTFSVGILSSALPRFRVFTTGVGCSACCEAAACTFTCAVNLGPAFNGLPNGGGPSLDPDTIIHAVGPNVAAPGLNCFCHGTPINPIPCSSNLVSQTSTNPSLAAAAMGATPSGSNNFGDNSRYFVVFDYVKRESTIRSPFVRAQPVSVVDPIWLEPIFHPAPTAIPPGAQLQIGFRASPTGIGQFSFDGFVAPEDIGLLNGTGSPYIQFEAKFIANTSTQIVPSLDEIVIPFRAQ